MVGHRWLYVLNISFGESDSSCAHKRIEKSVFSTSDKRTDGLIVLAHKYCGDTTRDQQEQRSIAWQWRVLLAVHRLVEIANAVTRTVVSVGKLLHLERAVKSLWPYKDMLWRPIKDTANVDGKRKFLFRLLRASLLFVVKVSENKYSENKYSEISACVRACVYRVGRGCKGGRGRELRTILKRYLVDIRGNESHTNQINSAQITAMLRILVNQNSFRSQGLHPPQTPPTPPLPSHPRIHYHPSAVGRTSEPAKCSFTRHDTSTERAVSSY